MVKWRPNREWRGHYESPGVYVYTIQAAKMGFAEGLRFSWGKLWVATDVAKNQCHSHSDSWYAVGPQIIPLYSTWFLQELHSNQMNLLQQLGC